MVGASKTNAPQILGRYAVYDKIASGGMATVHLGRLLGPVGFARTIAIKRLHAHLAQDHEFVSMFLDEARLAARISHPNVVQTLDVVANDDDLLLVMEYVRGESLAKLIRAAVARQEPIPPEIATAIMAGVLHGLHAAHEATDERGQPLGMVHRDVSPHNVLVGTDGVARVLDFGVAKATGRIQTTREGQLKGKLAYMAPEQTRGEVSRATDVYAASVVLWEALTGRRLFGGESDGEVLCKILQGQPEAPSRHAAGISRELDAVTLRGLDADPAKRFQTARDMAVALEDATPPVRSSSIGAWVQTLAGASLADRSHRIQLIESDSAGYDVTSGQPAIARAPSIPPRSSGVARAEVQRDEGQSSVGVTDDMILTQLSSGSVSAARLAAASGELRFGRTAIVACAAAGVAVALAVAFSVARSRDSAAVSPAPIQATKILAPVAAAASSLGSFLVVPASATPDLAAAAPASAAPSQPAPTAPIVSRPFAAHPPAPPPAPPARAPDASQKSTSPPTTPTARPSPLESVLDSRR